MFNPITYIKNYIEKRKRIRKAMKLLVLAGTVRPVDEEIVHRTADGKTRRIFVK
jgi:hypothetical protein